MTVKTGAANIVRKRGDLIMVLKYLKDLKHVAREDFLVRERGRIQEHEHKL